MLFKGREWAWKNKDWDNVKHFNKTQKAWTIAGIVFFIMVFVISFVVGFMTAVPNFEKYQAKAKMSEAKAGLVTFYTQAKLYELENGNFPANLDQVEFNPSHYRNYEFGFANTSEKIAKVCPDCLVYTTQYKFAAVGNVDDDDDLDVWVIDQDKNMVHLQNDLEN